MSILKKLCVTLRMRARIMRPEQALSVVGFNSKLKVKLFTDAL
jgi:hypothetical protein